MSEVPTGLHGRPDADELLEAVVEFLRDTLFPTTPEGHRFHLRVALNVLEIVRREITSGPEMEREHRRRLAELGLADELELAGQIRAGTLSGDSVRDAVTASVLDKLRVANPGYITEEDGR